MNNTATNSMHDCTQYEKVEYQHVEYQNITHTSKTNDDCDNCIEKYRECATRNGMLSGECWQMYLKCIRICSSESYGLSVFNIK